MSEENDENAPGARIALPPLSESASQRRSLDERLFVLLPSLYRRLSDMLLRLPQRSRLRRSMLIRRMRRAYAAANRRDFDVILTGLDPETEYRPGADLIAPDQDPVFRGHDGYLQMWQNWLGAFEDLRFDPRGGPRPGRHVPRHGSADGTRIPQRRGRKSTGFSTLQGPARLGGLAAGLQGSLGRPRSRRTAGVGDVGGEHRDRQTVI